MPPYDAETARRLDEHYADWLRKAREHRERVERSRRKQGGAEEGEDATPAADEAEGSAAQAPRRGKGKGTETDGPSGPETDDPARAAAASRTASDPMSRESSHTTSQPTSASSSRTEAPAPSDANVTRFTADPTRRLPRRYSVADDGEDRQEAVDPRHLNDEVAEFMGELPERLVILKLGGSIITQKSTLGGIRYDVVKRIASEIAKSAEDTRIVVVHGGGSFGHPLARLYHIYGRGKRAPPEVTDGRWRREGASAIQRSMLRLNAYLIGALVDSGLPALSVPGGILAELHDGELMRFHPGSIERYLASGLVPVTFGDVAPDRRRGVAIVSGDTLMLALAERLKPDLMVFATDRDGIYTSDPETDEQATLIEEADPARLRGLAKELLAAQREGTPRAGDATGGMALKIMELAEAAEAGIEGRVVNGLVPGRIEAALRGASSEGTRVLAREQPRRPRFPHV